VRGNTARLKVYVRSGSPYQSLDLDLRYDDSQLIPRAADSRDVGAQVLLAQRVVNPGVLRVAFASSEPVTRRHGALLTLTFDVKKSGPRLSGVEPLLALIDESHARISSNARLR
jgi:hypothetical protein